MKIKQSIAKLHKSKAEVPEMAATLCRCIFLFLFNVGGCGNCDCAAICLAYLQKANPNGFAYDSDL